MASYMNNQAARDLAMGAEVRARQTAIDLLEQAILRIGHPRNLDIEDCPSCGIRAAQNLILNHWRTHDELRAQLNAVRDKAETWYKRYKDQGREDYASAEKTNASISTAIRQLQDGDARAALDTLMLERYGYPLPEDYVWKAKPQRTEPAARSQQVDAQTIRGPFYTVRIVNLDDPPADYKLAHDLIEAEREIAALKCRMAYVEELLRTKTTMPSAEEQK